jgi:fermentation-respiration switch protein FrsA (DUF1100 family)
MANGRSLYVIHGTADTRINVRHSYQLQERAATDVDATFWFPEGVEHVQAASAKTAEYEQRLISFFQDSLGE